MSLIKSIGNKKVNLDFNKNFITTFSDKINIGDLQFINQTLKDLHPSDVANLIENLAYETRVKLIEIESFNVAPEIFIELNESIQSEVLQLLSIDSISNGECFDVKWLNKHGNIGSSQFRKLATGPRMSSFLDLITTSRASFNNCNSSAWKLDLLAINGYDERMLYGGPDRELGSRLENYKVSGKQVRHTVLCLHLDHPRGYKTKESLDRNLAIRASTKKENKVWTDYGIVKDETNN